MGKTWLTPMSIFAMCAARWGWSFNFPKRNCSSVMWAMTLPLARAIWELDRAEVRARVQRAMAAVGLGFEEFKDRHTFSLSGGERRRVALAGVLALEPRILVLDEPTAGLDPAARRVLLDYILALHRNGISLVMISHNMEELAAICNRLVVHCRWAHRDGRATQRHLCRRCAPARIGARCAGAHSGDRRTCRGGATHQRANRLYCRAGGSAC